MALVLDVPVTEDVTEGLGVRLWVPKLRDPLELGLGKIGWERDGVPVLVVEATGVNDLVKEDEREGLPDEVEEGEDDCKVGQTPETMSQPAPM